MKRNLLVVIFVFLLFSNNRYVLLTHVIINFNVSLYGQDWQGIWCQYKYYRVKGEDECKDVTVGDCELKADQIVYSSIISDAGLCQFLCNTLTDCNVFQFRESKQNCTLLKEDYHQDCKSSSGPEVSSIVKKFSIFLQV